MILFCTEISSQLFNHFCNWPVLVHTKLVTQSTNGQLTMGKWSYFVTGNWRVLCQNLFVCLWMGICIVLSHIPTSLTLPVAAAIKQAAAPSPGVAPGICSWEVNPCGTDWCQQGTVVSTGLHVGSLCHFVFFCKNCVLKKNENRLKWACDGNFWWLSVVVVKFCGLDIVDPARVSGLLGLEDHLRQR